MLQVLINVRIINFACVLNRGLNSFQEKLEKAESRLAQKTLQPTARLQLRPKASKLDYTTQKAVKGSHQHNTGFDAFILLSSVLTLQCLCIWLVQLSVIILFLITGVLKKEAQ